MNPEREADLRRILNTGDNAQLAEFFGLKRIDAQCNFRPRDWQSLRTVSSKGGYTVANKLAGQLARQYGIGKYETIDLQPVPLDEP